MYCRKIENRDLDEVVRLHRRAYALEHLTARFSPTLLRAYYAAIIEGNPYAFIAAESNGAALGFVVGGTNTHSAIRRFVRRHALGLGFVLLRNPKFLLKKLAHMGGFLAPAPRSNAPMRLLSIAVESGSQGKGVGSVLLERFERELLADGISAYGLSVRVANVTADRFYRTHGFVLEYEDRAGKYYTKNLVALESLSA